MKAAAALMAMILAGCATVGPPAPDTAWSLQASATAGAALTRTDAAGHDQLRIACRRHPADLYVASDGASGTSGAVALQIDGQVFPLTASDEPRLAASGPIPSALPAALMSARTLSLEHPGGRVGPFPAPDPKTAASFLISCRG